MLLSESFAAISAGAPGVSWSGLGLPATAELPAGTVTFLLTDIEGSTRLWETVPEAMEAALERHDSVLGEVISGHGGVVVTSRGEGDSVFAVFASAVSAVEAAGACQLRLGAEAWPAGAALRVRMGLHTGDAQVQQGDYVDHAPINRCARVKAAAHGGQVLLTSATRDLVGGRLGGGFGLKRLGEFRLRDLAGPELLYQLTHAGLLAEFPPLVTVAERAGNLPLPVSSFIGRERELEQTAATLGQARVVTLTGPGGVGKTRLALQAAAQVAPRFGDGAWLCELAPVRDPAGVDDAVAAVFSVSARGGHSTRQALVEFLRGKQLLLVLDNCEHLIEGAAALAGALARSCERLVILATSREALEIDGERLVPVPPLGVPGAGADLAAITDAGAVRLFADRAAAVKPGFAVTAGNAAAVAAVVRRLDGIALAIELAAARVPSMTAAELARRLERSFAVLGTGRRGAAERHHTLRAAIDWSVDLLAGAEQTLLARLAVFAGGCSASTTRTRPVRASSSRSAEDSRAPTVTRVPAAASPRTMARPIPLLPPVTTALRPARSRSMACLPSRCPQAYEASAPVLRQGRTRRGNTDGRCPHVSRPARPRRVNMQELISRACHSGRVLDSRALDVSSVGDRGVDEAFPGPRYGHPWGKPHSRQAPSSRIPEPGRLAHRSRARQAAGRVAPAR